jgi:hypothetical protein
MLIPKLRCNLERSKDRKFFHAFGGNVCIGFEILMNDRTALLRFVGPLNNYSYPNQVGISVIRSID